jgi:hypothetical protein
MFVECVHLPLGSPSILLGAIYRTVRSLFQIILFFVFVLACTHVFVFLHVSSCQKQKSVVKHRVEPGDCFCFVYIFIYNKFWFCCCATGR